MSQPQPATPAYVCPRCGQARIIAKTWEEISESAVNSPVIKHTLLICPDPECQAKQDKEIAAQQAKRQMLTDAKEQRKKAAAAS